jgi:hypothetical protein
VTPELTPESAPEPPPKAEDDDIPELIQDTQPALAILNDLPPSQPEARKRIDDTLPDIAALSAELDAAVKSPEPAVEQKPAPKPAPKTAQPARPAAGGNAAKSRTPTAPAKAALAPAAKRRAKPRPKPVPKPAPKQESPPPATPTQKAAARMPKPAVPRLTPEPSLESRAEPKAEPRIAPKEAPKPEPELKLELEPELERKTTPADDETIPTLSEPATATAPDNDKQAEEEVPDWDRDPTLAELRPDLDALERAMAVAQGRDPAAGDDAAPTPEPEKKAPPKEEIEAIPEITLDESINRKVDRAALERKKRLEEEGLVEAEPEVEESSDVENQARVERSAAELEKIAEGLARAKTIEDVDDKMAETLFGEELSVAAAAVAARVAEEAAAEAAEASETPVADAPAAADAPARTAMEKEFENVWGETPGDEVSLDYEAEDQQGGLDISASQRLATVRALNTGKPESAGGNGAGSPAAPTAKPDSIEEQITTSLTQTMKALKVNPDPAAINDDDDDDDERKGGFFSRFRRS